MRPLTAAPGLDGWAVGERLLTDLARLEGRLWLVIDDAHLLGSDGVLPQLELLVLRAPPDPGIIATGATSLNDTVRGGEPATSATAWAAMACRWVRQNLEGRGLVRREPDPADGRFTNAILTGKGFQTLAEAAPGHVAHVRSLVIDVLSPEQLRRLGRDSDRIMSRIDTTAIN